MPLNPKFSPRLLWGISLITINKLTFLCKSMMNLNNNKNTILLFPPPPPLPNILSLPSNLILKSILAQIGNYRGRYSKGTRAWNSKLGNNIFGLRFALITIYDNCLPYLLFTFRWNFLITQICMKIVREYLNTPKKKRRKKSTSQLLKKGCRGVIKRERESGVEEKRKFSTNTHKSESEREREEKNIFRRRRMKEKDLLSSLIWPRKKKQEK